MSSYLSIFLLAFAVSLDSFGVGLNYGLRRIIVPKVSILIIAVCSGLMMIVSMVFGALILPFFPDRYANLAGGAILIAIGLWVFVQMLRKRADGVQPENAEGGRQTVADADRPDSEDGARLEHAREDRQSCPAEAEPAQPMTETDALRKRVFRLEIRRLSIMIEILRKPSRADMDRSGTITAEEAALLGTALSLDAFGAGVGAAWLGLSPWLTAPAIAVFCALFLQCGIFAGNLAAGVAWMRRLTFLPALILIMLGLSRIVQ